MNYTFGINITNKPDKPHNRHLPNVSKYLQIPPTCQGAAKAELLHKGKQAGSQVALPSWDSRTAPSTPTGDQGKLRGPPGAGHGQRSGGDLRGGWTGLIRPLSAPQGPDTTPP